MKIEQIALGLPAKTGTDLTVRVMPFETDALTCSLYYEVKAETGEMLASGNLQLTEAEFAEWGQSNEYIDNLALTKLELQRL